MNRIHSFREFDSRYQTNIFFFLTNFSPELGCLPRQGSWQVTELLSWRDILLPWLGGKSSASAGKSGLAGNMTDSAQICNGRFTNSAPADAIVAALAGSECHQPGTASVQLPIWH
ncbi:hypothetical protein V6N13_037324 [Hibiscus sabdariffa]